MDCHVEMLLQSLKLCVYSYKLCEGGQPLDYIYHKANRMFWFFPHWNDIEIKLAALTHSLR